ncbi:hypothetical protein MKW94_006973 [Papaver nudicaule]|uniref:CRC domain-containing protein n=1 Tax=Papaver nudicaule TaxID=74823 RepID=A0AA41VA48_PAPNU|nr:hypothetical protein [Papaver nudicaule]
MGLCCDLEDSPVFSYLNNLSPIESVRSDNNSQTLNSLSFSSPPSVFTPPNVSSSQKESGFLRRHFFSDSSKLGLASDIGNGGSTRVTDAETDGIFNCSADPPQNPDLGSGSKEVHLPNETLELSIELPLKLKYGCDSPESNPVPRHEYRTDLVREITGTASSLRQLVQPSLVKCSCPTTEVGVQEISQPEQKNDEEEGSDWENMISDAAGLLVLDPSSDAEATKEQPDPNISSLNSRAPNLTQESLKGLPETQSGCPGNDNLDTGECSVQNNSNCTPQKLQSDSQSKKPVKFPNEKVDEKAKTDCKQQRGTRRRCLLFEMGGGLKRILENDSSSPSDGKVTSDVRQLVPFKAGSKSSPCMVPGIGLHLNALAVSRKVDRVVKHETLPSEKSLISMPSHITSLHSVKSELQPISKTFSPSSLERYIGPAVSEDQVVQDASQASVFGIGEEFNESGSPRKRRRMFKSGEDESCKRCSCKKSKCLKLYCECFAAGVYCVEPCSCVDCFNKPIQENTVLSVRKQIESRNPLAFAPKVISHAAEIGGLTYITPASARHKRGCNCKKSSCLKKYCECFQGGAGCSIKCKCEGCKNAFGTKDSYVPVVEEIEPEGEESDGCEKNTIRKCLQISEAHKDKGQYPEHVTPITPFQISRMSVQLEFSSSSGKPPRPSIFPVGSSPRLLTNHIQQISGSLPTPLKLEKQFQNAAAEDETTEILKGGNSSPISGVKTASPKHKRVLPPHGKKTRKLVLKSVPSLAFHDQTDDHQ